MKLDFSKMHGAGNDFIVIWEADRRLVGDAAFTTAACDRRRGVGADGIIFLSRAADSQKIKMDFYNCDGSRASMCGNGLRCAAMFASKNVGAGAQIDFITDAGELRTWVRDPMNATIQIPVLEDFRRMEVDGQTCFFGNTGVPHLVVVVDGLESYDVDGNGGRLRNHPAFAPAGTNVNFVSMPSGDGGTCLVRTYERGVEGETLCCGTGVSASAICAARFFGKKFPVRLINLNKDVLCVEKNGDENILRGVLLTGPAVEVCKGVLDEAWLDATLNVTQNT